MKIQKNNRGITLIALIITIIVLLILAGVAIAAITRDDNIVTNANKASTEMEKSSEIEKIKLSYQEASISKYDDNSKRLDEIINEAGYAEAIYNEENDMTTVVMKETDRVYSVTTDGEVVELTSPTSWYTEDATTYYIYTVEQLKDFATKVNSGIDFSGKTVMLKSNIDLKNEAWTPIGNSSSKFKGKFDGCNKTISNLYMNLPSTDYIGFFGCTSNGSVENLTLNNVNITGKSSIGGLVGSSSTSDINNITVTGLVQITGERKVAGIVGNGVYSSTSNLTVNVSEGSFIKGTTTTDTNYAGGIFGQTGECGLQNDSIGYVHTNLTSNIDVIANNSYAGGIVGMAHYGTSWINCSSSGNVTITKATKEEFEYSIGGISGCRGSFADTDTKKGTITLTGCTYTGTLSSTDMNGNVVTEFKNKGLVGIPYNNVYRTSKLIIDGQVMN